MFSTNEVIVVDLGESGRFYDPNRLRLILVMNHDSELGEI